MPAYNEEINIGKTVEDWYMMLEGKSPRSRLVVDDSESTDQTHEILISLQKELPQLEIVRSMRKEHGPKVIGLYQYAIMHNADYVFQTDSDGQTNPKEFEKIWKMRKQYDGIFGNRRKREDGIGRALIEKGIVNCLYFYFHISVPDANAPFRLMNVTVLKNYMDYFEEDCDLPNIMLVVLYAHYKEAIKFCDISFKAREGRSSIDLFKIVKIGWNAMHEFRVLKIKMNI